MFGYRLVKEETLRKLEKRIEELTEALKIEKDEVERLKTLSGEKTVEPKKRQYRPRKKRSEEPQEKPVRRRRIKTNE